MSNFSTMYEVIVDFERGGELRRSRHGRQLLKPFKRKIRRLKNKNYFEEMRKSFSQNIKSWDILSILIQSILRRKATAAELLLLFIIILTTTNTIALC